ncbi:MAG: MBOAT family protein [Lachnospiraceae bacterium]|nr:MBOAT family protein [Lachnospiraceae bacterium]
MVFSDTPFLFLFLPALLILYYNPFVKSRTFRNIILMLASVFFYAWGEPFFVFIMLGSIVVNWVIALLMNENNKKLLLILDLTFNIGIFFVFKYLGFVADNLSLLFGTKNMAINIALPIGISFYSFQIMSYVIDVYRKEVEVQKNLFDLVLYVSFFPQLIAGPIVRYENIADELENRTETKADFTQGMIRFVYGLAKKVLIADYIGSIVDNVWATDNRTVALAWIGAIAYTLQIYFDFSGYSDMAIGMGRMFGFHFRENFNYPYVAKSITEFWRRWHMSLSGWFRDYVYIPLGGNRKGLMMTYRNMFVVWLLTGIWHGANWTFIAWGLFYFAFLFFEKKYNFAPRLKGFGHVYTMLVVIFGWILFRSDSISQAVIYIGQMFGIGAVGFWNALSLETLTSTWAVLVVGIIGSFPVKNVFAKLGNRNEKAEEVVNVLNAMWVMIIFMLALFACAKATYSPFLYFNF